MENNKNQSNQQENEVQKEQVEHKGIKLPLFLYHFPNGTKGLMLHLNDVEDVEVIPVYPPMQPEQ